MTRTGALSSFRNRFLIASTLVLVTAAACGGDSSSDQPPSTLPETTTAAAPETTTTTAAPPQTTTATMAPETTTTNASQTTVAPETTTTAAAPDFEPTLLSYHYPSSGEVEYAVSIEQQAEVRLDGGAPAEMPPGPITVNSILAGTLSYRTDPGAEENTTIIRILSDFKLVENEASMGGITLPADEIDDAPGFETPIDITVVVDQQGNVLEFSSKELDDLFGAENFLPNSSAGNQQFSRPVGPAFPDHPVDVGDTWTERTEEEGPGGMVITNAEHRLVAVQGTEERPILVVESEYQTEAFEWDMSEFLTGMFGAFSGELPEDEAQEGQEVLSEFKLLISVIPGPVQATTWFDPQAGLVIESEHQAQGEVTTHMTIPGETGEPFTISTATAYDQVVFYQLINPTT